MMRKASIAVNTVVIIIVALIVLVAIMSFVISTTQTQRQNIDYQRVYSEKCTQIDCNNQQQRGFLQMDTGFQESCKQLYNINAKQCVEEYCCKISVINLQNNARDKGNTLSAESQSSQGD
ncbi:MAG: hypothetical protein ABIG30_01920 [Candidatus Aenigmatarchaeota archaeon]